MGAARANCRWCTKALLGVARSSLYYRPTGDSAEELALMRRIDRIFTDHPMYGSRRMQVALAREGAPAGRINLDEAGPDSTASRFGYRRRYLGRTPTGFVGDSSSSGVTRHPLEAGSDGRVISLTVSING